MKITLAQLNPVIGSFDENLEKMETTLKQVYDDHPDIVVFSELIFSGYPPLDLLERPSFVRKCLSTQERLVEVTRTFPDTAVLVGNIRPTGRKAGKRLYNSAFLIQNGDILFCQDKTLLPTYDVFDEARYFDPAPSIDVFDFKDECLGITICEDAWNNPILFPDTVYPVDPVSILAEKGATLLINISASPFGIGKDEKRYLLLKYHTEKYGVPFLMLNQAGANDELISGGLSMCLDGRGEAISLFPSFEEHVETIDLKQTSGRVTFTPADTVSSVHDALILGIRDYMAKCGFSTAVLGLSGGIDSALTCCLAAKAIGPENITAVSMPSEYSSKGSVDDAKKLASNLGIELKSIPIAPMVKAYIASLNDHFDGKAEDKTEENIQARVRGNILMALSNKHGSLTLSSGNKSELAVGYCTLYGDMTGGLGVLSDVPKTLVYDLASHINRDGEIIPESILAKSPSAELKPGQTDQDTLPPYDILDAILKRYVDDHASKDDIVAEGFDAATVDWVIHAVKANEHKRRQAAPGLKITPKAFGSGRRLPIAAKFVE